MDKEEFAREIVEGYDMDGVVDSAIQGILANWERYPENLKEEIENRQDILNGKELEE